MQQATTTPANTPAETNTQTSASTESCRTFWIYTGYVATGLALLGVLAYHFSSYILK
jgi:hypothetical protein